MEDNDKDDDNNKDDNNDKGISVPGLDRDLGFSRGHQGRQGHRPHDDDDDDEEEDNDKDNDNNKDDKNDKGISSLGPPRKHTVQQQKFKFLSFGDPGFF